MDPLIVFWLIVFIVILFLAARWLLGLQIITVREGQQQVVYRFGRFNRILQPGLHMILNRFDTLEQVINVREQPDDLLLDGFYIYDVPFGYTLNLWFRNDPVAVATDKRNLANFILFTDEERRGQVIAKIREALVRSVSEAQKQREPATNKPLVYKLLPIFPGTEENTRVLDKIRDELVKSLPSIGVIMNQTQPIVIKKIHLAQHVITNFQRGFTVSTLREFFPGISQPRVMHMLSAIEGLDVSRIQEIALQNENAQTDVKLKVDGSGTARVDLRPATAGTSTAALVEQNGTVMAQATPAPNGHLTPDDLRVLKRVPRQQRAA